MKIKLPQRMVSPRANRIGAQFQTAPERARTTTSDIIKEGSSALEKIAFAEKRDHLRAVVQDGRVMASTFAMNELNDFKQNYRGKAVADNPRAALDVRERLEGKVDGMLANYTEREQELIRRSISDINSSFDRGINSHVARETENYRAETAQAEIANNVAMAGQDLSNWAHYEKLAVSAKQSEGWRRGVSREVMEADVRSVYNGTTTGVVNALLDAGQIKAAMAHLESKKSEIDQDVYLALKKKTEVDNDLLTMQSTLDKMIAGKYTSSEGLDYIRSHTSGKLEEMLRRRWKEYNHEKRAETARAKDAMFEETTILHDHIVDAREKGELEKAEALQVRYDKNRANMDYSQRKILDELLADETKKTDNIAFRSELIRRMYEDPQKFKETTYEELRQNLPKAEADRWWKDVQEFKRTGQLPINREMDPYFKEILDLRGIKNKKERAKWLRIFRNFGNANRQMNNGEGPSMKDYEDYYERQQKSVKASGVLGRIFRYSTLGLFAPDLEDVDPLSVTNVSQLPMESVESARVMLQNMGKSNPTDKEILKFWQATQRQIMEDRPTAIRDFRKGMYGSGL